MRGLEALTERVLLAADFAGSAPPRVGWLATEEMMLLEARQIPARRNVERPADVNGDRRVAPLDGLLLANVIQRVLEEADDPGAWLGGRAVYLDVSGDGVLTDEDYLSFLAAVRREGGAASGQRSDVERAWGERTELAQGALSPSSHRVSGSQVEDGGASLAASFDAETWEGSYSVEGSSGDADGDGGSSGGEPSDDEPAQDPPPVERPQPPGACHATLASTTVVEAQRFTLPLEYNAACFTGYQVDWGDGIAEVFDAGQPAVHLYEDDPVPGTSRDDYSVVVRLWTDAASEMPGESRQLTATVTVRNRPPTANPDSGPGFLTDEDSRITTISVLTNDDDPSFFDEISLVLGGFDAGQTKGLVSYAGNGRFHYDPNGQFECLGEGETATDSFVYWMHDDDDLGAIRSAVVTIQILGNPEHYTLDYGSALAAEDGQRPATVRFTLTPPARCGSVYVYYHPAAYDGPASLPAAGETDMVTPSRGVVEIREGAALAELTFTPVDDQVIEENELFFFAVDPAAAPDYRVVPRTRQAFVLITDDEWRFVAETRSLTNSIGPLPVEAFVTALSAGYLEAWTTYRGAHSSGVGGTADSTARALATAVGRLTRPGDPTNVSDDQVSLEFVCDSQTGDVWARPVTRTGEVQDGPLGAAVSVNFAINDIGSLEAYLVVNFQADVVAGGTITQRDTISAGLNIGMSEKGQAAGGIEWTSQVSYEGGRHYREAAGFTFLCRRGSP
jgi:hypothetical protein